MSDNQQITFTITAKDGTKQTFAAIGTAGSRMGADIAKGAKAGSTGVDHLGKEAAGTQKELVAAARSADQAGTSMRKLGADADRSSSAFTKGKAAGAAFGATMGAMTGLLSDATRAFAESEAIQTALQQQIENTGASYEDYAAKIETATDAAMQLAFDDELVAQSLTKLTAITNDAGQSLDLLSVAMDLSRGTGMNLVNASNLIGKVAEGNTGILKRYGIVVEEGASAQEALAQIQTRFAGQAEAYGTTQSAVFDRIQISLGNYMESIGEAAGGIAPLLMVLPGLSAGITGVGAAAGLAGPALLSVGKGAAASRVGVIALTAATGPLGLGLAAAAAAAGLVYLGVKFNEVDNEARAASEGIITLGDAVGRLSATSVDTDAIAGLANTVGDFESVLEQAADATDRGAEQLRFGSEELDAAITDISESFAQPGIDGEALARAYDAVFMAIESGAINSEEAGRQIAAISDHWFEYTDAAIEAAAVTDIYTVELAKLEVAWRGVDGAAQSASDSDWAKVAEYNAKQTAEWEAKAASLAETYRGVLLPAIHDFTGGLAEFIPVGFNTIDALTTLQNLDNISLQIQTDGFEGLAEKLYDLKASWLNVAAGVENGGMRLDGVIALYGTIDALGARMEAAAGIANNLFGADGNAWDGLGPLNDLLYTGRISVEEFNAAVDAGTGIQNNNAESQAMLNQMRAQQLPALASTAEVYRLHLESLASLAPAEQEHALAMLDAGNQAKVAAAYSAAYSASLGEIPKDVATEIIASGAQADPVIGKLLKEMGLIEEGAEGELKVNFPDGESMVSVTKDLTASIDALTLALDGVPPSTTVDVKVDTTAHEEGMASIRNANAELNGSTINTTATTDTSNHDAGMASVRDTLAALNGQNAHTTTTNDPSSAHAGIEGAHAALTGIDGRTSGTHVVGEADGVHSAVGGAHSAMAGIDGVSSTVTIYADDSPMRAVLNNVPQGGVVGSGVVWITAQGPGIGFTPSQHGGVVGLASGGIVPALGQSTRTVLVGEAGPELLQLAPGSRVVPHTMTQVMLDGGMIPGMAGGGTIGPQGAGVPWWGREEMMYLSSLIERGRLAEAKDQATAWGNAGADTQGDMQSLGFTWTKVGGKWVAGWSRAGAVESELWRDSDKAAAMGLEGYFSDAFGTAKTAPHSANSGSVADSVTFPSGGKGITGGGSVAAPAPGTGSNIGSGLSSGSDPTKGGGAGSYNSWCAVPKEREQVVVNNYGTIATVEDMADVMDRAMTLAASKRTREVGLRR